MADVTSHATQDDVGEIDRTKHDIDVMERVLGSASSDAAWSEVVELSARPWLGGITGSAIQIQVGRLGAEDTGRRDDKK